MQYDIYPSLPAADFAALRTQVQAVADVTTTFQVDIVDGEYAFPPSWPYNQTEAAVTDSLLLLQELSESLQLEVDCMVMEPRQYFPSLAAAGVARVVLHIDSSTDMPATIAAAKECGLTVGLGIHTAHIWSEYQALLETVSYVQVMGIAVVGAQGQPFDERSLDIITQLRTAYPSMSITVDGSVNTTTIPRLIMAGANILAPGSAVTKAADSKTALTQLRAVMNRLVL